MEGLGKAPRPRPVAFRKPERSQRNAIHERARRPFFGWSIYLSLVPSSPPAPRPMQTVLFSTEFSRIYIYVRVYLPRSRVRRQLKRQYIITLTRLGRGTARGRRDAV